MPNQVIAHLYPGIVNRKVVNWDALYKFTQFYVQPSQPHPEFTKNIWYHRPHNDHDLEKKGELFATEAQLRRKMHEEICKALKGSEGF